MKRPGFTLVELMATMAILMVITIGIIVQFTGLSPAQTLENASDLLRSGFVEMRTAAVTSQTCCNGVLPPAYGLSITMDGPPDNTIYYFADIDGDYLYTAADELLRTIVMSDVDVTECTDGTTTITAGTCTVAIAVGRFQGLYYGASTFSSPLTVTLTHPRSSQLSKLIIYPQVYVIE